MSQCHYFILVSICLISWDIYNYVYKIFVFWPWLWILTRNDPSFMDSIEKSGNCASFFVKSKCPWLSRHCVMLFHLFQENHKAKVNSNLLLSCLNEAGKSSIFCSLDSLNQCSTQPRHFKKNSALRKLSSDPPITVTSVTGGKLIFYLGHGTDCRREEMLNNPVQVPTAVSQMASPAQNLKLICTIFLTITRVSNQSGDLIKNIERKTWK